MSIEDIEEPKVREFDWNGKTFYVFSSPCSEEDSVKILTAIIHQAVKDFERLAHPSQRTSKASRESWSTASKFLFDNDYIIDYGDVELNLKEMLYYINPEGSFSVSSLRRSLVSKTIEYWEKEGKKLSDNFWLKEDKKDK